jgi:hypothetical protein
MSTSAIMASLVLEMTNFLAKIYTVLPQVQLWDPDPAGTEKLWYPPSTGLKLLIKCYKNNIDGRISINAQTFGPKSCKFDGIILFYFGLGANNTRP